MFNFNSRYVKDINEPLTIDELHVLGVMTGVGLMPGGFIGSLIVTISHADMVNAGKLHSVYPELVDAVKGYQEGNLFMG